MTEIQNSNLTQITSEILLLKQQTAQNIIEIGKRLITAKEMLPHGEWGKWLDEKVEFSDRTARRFMQVASELSNRSALTDLPQTKVFALLDLPADQREEFATTTHTVNGTEKTVDEMTSRELQKVIRERDKLQNDLQTANGTIEYQKTIISQKENSIQALAKREPTVIEKEVEKVVMVETIPEDYDKLRKDSEILKMSNTRLSEAYNKITKDKQSLEKELESLKKVNAAAGEYDNKIIESALFFVSKVHGFIEQVGGLAWVAQEIGKLPGNERKAYLKAIQLVQDWVTAVSYQIDTEQRKYIE